MPDRESVITHLQIIRTWAAFARERDLQFFTKRHLEDIAQWSDDGIALLKGQEAKLVRIDEDSVHCPSCGNELFTFPRQKFCDECGQELKWDA